MVYGRRPGQPYTGNEAGTEVDLHSIDSRHVGIGVAKTALLQACSLEAMFSLELSSNQTSWNSERLVLLVDRCVEWRIT
jgi:hypothetical protein